MAANIIVGGMDEDRFDRSKRIPWLDIERISSSRVLVVGAGALGNEVSKNLALSGYRRISIVDMDHVVLSNLNRCIFFNEEDARARRNKAEAVAAGVSAMAPNARPEAVCARIESQPDGFIGHHDLVFGCLDNVLARLHVNAHSYVANVPYIDGGMEGMIGRVTVVTPPNGACLQCGMNRSHAKVAQMRFSCTGRDVVFHEPRLAAEVTTTSLISAVMVREGLKVASGRRDLLLKNVLYYDGQRNVAEELEIPVDPDCPVHQGVRADYRYPKTI
jgi:molybdopterin/thiamine biosynthesis adenylyltransferase